MIMSKILISIRNMTRHQILKNSVLSLNSHNHKGANKRTTIKYGIDPPNRTYHIQTYVKNNSNIDNILKLFMENLMIQIKSDEEIDYDEIYESIKRIKQEVNG